MNYEWAERRVAEFIQKLELNFAAWNGGDQVTERLSTIAGRGWAHSAQLPAAQILYGALRDAEEIAENVGPQGPKLAATDFHAWVWDHAAGLWGSGFPREAVRAAATAIFDSDMPTFLGVPKDTPLEALAATFKTDAPKVGQPRLRISGYEESTEDFQNAQQGAQNLGLACGKLVRNLSAHTVTEHPENEALEELAMLSRFARLVTSSNGVTNSAE